MYKTCILLFKAKHNSLPVNVQKLFSLNFDNIHITRQNNLFKVKYARTSLKAKCVSICGVKLWNSLPTDVSNCHSLMKFKKLLKSQYLACY